MKLLKKWFSPKPGAAMSIVGAVVGGVIGIIVLAKLAVALWPTLAATGTDVAALTQTDAGTEMLQGIWPIVLVVVGVGLAAGAIFFVLRKFGVMR